MSNAAKKSILIVDPEKDFLEKMKSGAKKTDLAAITCSDHEEATRVLENFVGGISATFVSSSLEDCTWVKAVESAHQHRPGIPIILMNDVNSEASEFTDEELESIGIRQSIIKPTDYKQLIEIVAPMTVSFDTNTALKIAKKNKDTIGQSSTSKDADFSSIRSDNFISGSQTIFDLYIKLGPDHYLKILQAGDSFEPDRLAKYHEKGVTHFYLKKEVQETYLKYCEHLTSRILKSSKVKIEFKLGFTLNQGEEVSKFLEKANLTDDEVKYASNFVSNVQEIYKQLDPRKSNNVMNAFVNDVSSYEHGVACSMLSSLLAKELKIESSYAVQVIGVGALLHDIGMQTLPKELRDEDDEMMMKEQLYQFHKHPDLGAVMLGSLKTIDKSVPHAVASHHVRRNNLGFPKHAGATQMNQVAEIIGIADEYLRLIIKSNKRPEMNIQPLKVMEEKIFDGFTRQMVEAFKKLFVRKIEI